MSTRSLLPSSPLSSSPSPSPSHSSAVSPASAFSSSSERARSRRHRFTPEQSAWIRSQLRGLSPHGKSWRRLFDAFRSAFPEDRASTLVQYKQHAKYHARRREQQQQQCGGSQRLRRRHDDRDDGGDDGEEDDDDEEDEDDCRDQSRRRRSLVESLRGPEIGHWKRPRDAELVDATVDEFEMRIKCDDGAATSRPRRVRPPPLRIAQRTPVTSSSSTQPAASRPARAAVESKRVCKRVKNETFLEWLLEHRAVDAPREKIEPTRPHDAFGRRLEDASAENAATERLLMTAEDLRGRLVQQEEKALAARMSAGQWQRLCADAGEGLERASIAVQHHDCETLRPRRKDPSLSSDAVAHCRHCHCC
ncbi:hypothetical protein PINS_up016951 [Pythium insidiosum]|nr:hypothetical protein PINS_up016951 [Pythium insidiosum]